MRPGYNGSVTSDREDGNAETPQKGRSMAAGLPGALLARAQKIGAHLGEQLRGLHWWEFEPTATTTQLNDLGSRHPAHSVGPSSPAPAVNPFSSPAKRGSSGREVASMGNGARPSRQPLFHESPSRSPFQRAGAPPEAGHLRLQAELSQALAAPVADLQLIRALCCWGIPGRSHRLRAQCWRVLLKLVPLERGGRASALQRKRLQYEEWRQQASGPTRRPVDLLGPQPEARAAGAGPKRSEDGDDHPLTRNEQSGWGTFFRDKEMMDQMELDVRRTQCELPFFWDASSVAERHREELQRALFIFARLNPSVRYVQGMNEIAAPLYYVFSLGAEEGDASGAEADAFWAITELMADFRDWFSPTMDHSVQGIHAVLASLSRQLAARDPELWRHLEQENGVQPHFYALRWLSTLLTQVFAMDRVLPFWDHILCHADDRPGALLRVCLAMLCHPDVRAQLLRGDFAANVDLLQHYPEQVDVLEVLRVADSLR